MKTSVLDSFTLGHFYAWVDRTIHSGDQERIENLILDLLDADPELLAGHSWPELRTMAETLNG